jgi:hypothetical protein
MSHFGLGVLGALAVGNFGLGLTAKDTQRWRWVPGTPWGGNQAIWQLGNLGTGRIRKLGGPDCQVARLPNRPSGDVESSLAASRISDSMFA